MAFPVPQRAGALYHVTQRGHRGSCLFRKDADRCDFLSLLGCASQRYQWEVFAWCLMDNHVHLFLRTREPTLSRGMRFLTGLYAQRFNQRHGLRGTLYQGRYRAFLVEDEGVEDEGVEDEGHFLEVLRYVVLNPVHAGLVAAPEEWPWSSYRATAGLETAPRWLYGRAVLARLGGDVGEYRRFVAEGIRGEPLDWKRVGTAY
jgi:REP element-mobilizing transposase RayT